MHKYEMKVRPDEEDDDHHQHHNDKHELKPDILEATIGSFGRWQCMISVCMALLKLPIAWFQLGIVFLAPPTDYWCRQPEDYKLLPKDEWLSLIKPYNTSNFNMVTTRNERCIMNYVELPTDRVSLQPCKWGIEFDQRVFVSSIISEWHLVCGKEYYVDLTQSVLMFGVLVGSALFGSLADKHGRKRILLICIIMQSACSLLSAWSPWMEMFLTLRFGMAMANGGTMITSFVMCMEVVGGKWRHIVPILYQIPFGLGNTLMALVAYYLRTWREFQIALSFMSGAFIVYAWLIPESPRWLLATGRRREACAILEQAAAMNDIDVMRVRSRLLEYRKITKQEETMSFLTLFRTPNLRKRTLLLITTWLMNGLTLYGFTHYLGHLGSNIYFNVSIGGLISIPGTLLCVYIIGKCGLRWTIIIANVLIAACFLLILCVPVGVFANDWPRIVLAGLGVIGLAVAGSSLYLFTGELYPTVTRNVGVGFCIVFSRVGSMISPFIVSLGQRMPYLPLVLLACATLAQSGLVVPLPELSDSLADTISDVEMGKVKKPLRKMDHDDHLYGIVPDENPIMGH